MTNPDYFAVVPWRDVLPGDVIRGADGREWRIASVDHDADVVMIDFNDRIASGRPRPDAVVTVLKPAPIRRIMKIFADAGIPLTYLGGETES